jgi:hypothetical protein
MATTPPAAAPDPPSGAAPRTGDPAAPKPTADPEYPRDLAGPPVTVTGTVTVEYGCVILDNGVQRWALLGDQAERVREGSRVTVRGRRTKAPAGCRVYGGLDVISVS